MSSRIPPLLEPYLSLPPEASLILLTNVLGASSNWLVLRFLHSTLLSSEAASEASLEDEPKVLLVSFMRDLVFWKENARRLGLDLDKLTAKKRFAFVDGLSGLFLPKQQKEIGSRNGLKTLGSPELARISGEILQAVGELKDAKDGKVLLVVDQIDLLLATGGEKVDAVNLGAMLMGIQEHVHATIMTLASDYPLVSAQHTPLEINHAAFLLNTAHQADLIMSLRLLDTGTARDVSGVVRITVGEQAGYEQQEPSRTVEEKELLYFVGGDGGVKVFERGQ